jgi:hypothetical protein
MNNVQFQLIIGPLAIISYEKRINNAIAFDFYVDLNSFNVSADYMNIPLRIACPLATYSVPLFSMDHNYSESTALVNGIELIKCNSGRKAISALAAHKADIALATDEAFSQAIKSDTNVDRTKIVRLCDVSQGNVCFHIQSNNLINKNMLWDLLKNDDRAAAVVACPPETNYAGLVEREMNVEVVYIEDPENQHLLKNLIDKIQEVSPQVVLLVGLPNWIENVKTVLEEFEGKMGLEHRLDYREFASYGWLGTEEYGFYVNRDLLDGRSKDLNGEDRKIAKSVVYSTIRSILWKLNELSSNKEDLEQLVNTLKKGIQSDIQKTAGGSLSGLMSATRTCVNLRPTRYILSCWENEVNG